MSQKILDVVKPGVVTGEDVQKIFAIAKENQFAMPAVNVIGTDTMNAVLEAAAKVQSAVIIQFSNGGAQFVAGKGLKLPGQESNVLGAIAGAKHVHTVAEAYGVPVILHTDHARRSCCRGWTACSTRARSTSPRPASPCSARTCSTCRKSPCREHRDLRPIPEPHGARWA